MNYQTYKITPQFNIKVLLEPRGFLLSDVQKTEIETIWVQEQKNRPKPMYNGKILNFVKFENQEMVGEFIDYKFYLAKLRNPNFLEELKITPICVSGITVAGNKILLGKRTDQVTQYKNFYELVPSGGIDPLALAKEQIEIKRQFEQELWQETGISVTEIKKIEPFMILFDPVNNLYEICGEIQVNYAVLKEILHLSDEYQSFLWMTKNEFRDFFEKHPNEFVPLSLFLLKERRFIRH